MMAGEIEYENFIYENGDAIFPFTGHFMILLFVVLISIILMNLLVGLAVSDIQVTTLEWLCGVIGNIRNGDSLFFTHYPHPCPGPVPDSAPYSYY